MSSASCGALRSCQTVLPCTSENFADTADFYQKLGFRVKEIWPADSPEQAVLVGFGCSLRLRVEEKQLPVPTLILRLGKPPTEPVVVAPNQGRVEFEHDAETLVLPKLERKLVTTTSGEWSVGRAGMLYRDLIPSRLGGGLIASHIRIPTGGPVPDYVHYHQVAFQMIFCRKGWVCVVYEDQGPDFVMHEGDCVLQPPLIRHRVLESSAGLEVVELSAPASHKTLGDLAMSLPNTTKGNPDRVYGLGQRFARHDAKKQQWAPMEEGGPFEHQTIRISDATSGLASACVIRCRGTTLAGQQQPARFTRKHKDDVTFIFVLEGKATTILGDDRNRIELSEGNSILCPLGSPYSMEEGSFKLLQVTLPGDLNAFANVMTADDAKVREAHAEVRKAHE